MNAPGLKDPKYNDPKYVDKGVSELEDYANKRNPGAIPTTKDSAYVDKQIEDLATSDLKPSENQPPASEGGQDENLSPSGEVLPPPINYRGRKEGEKEEARGLAGFLMRRKKQAAAGGGIILLILGGGGGIVFIQLNQEKILANAMQRMAMRIVKKAVEKRIKRWVSSYVSHTLLFRVKTCGSSKNVECMNKAPRGNYPDNEAGHTMKAWDKISASDFFSDVGEIRYENGGFTFKFETGDVHIPEGDLKDPNFDLGKYVDGQGNKAGDSFFKKFRVTGAFDWAFDRLIASHFSKIYKLPLCNFFCDPDKSSEEAKKSQETKSQDFKAANDRNFNERTIKISAGFVSGLFQCLMDGNCNDPDKSEERVRQAREEVNIPAEGIDDAAKEGKKFKNFDFSKGLVIGLFEKITGKTISNSATEAIPIVGQVILAMRLYDGFGSLLDTLQGGSKFDPARPFTGDQQGLKIMANGLKEQQAAGAAQQMQTMGSETSAVDKGNALQARQASQERLQGFEKNTMYQKLFGSRSLFKNDSGKSPEDCGDNRKVNERGVCPQEDLTKPPRLEEYIKGNTALHTSFEAFNAARRNPNFAIVMFLIKKFDDLIQFVLTSIPGFDKIVGFIGDLTKELVQFAMPLITELANVLLDPLFKDLGHAKGPRLWGAWMMGMDLAGYSYGRDAIGGKDLSHAQSTKQALEVQQEELRNLHYASLGERLFSTDNQYSMVSRLALGSPISGYSSPGNFVASLNPFAMIGSSMFAFQSAHADDQPIIPDERYGFPGTGYPDDDQYLNSDPLAAPKDCPDGERKTDGRNEIGDKKYVETKGCMLDKEVNKIASGKFTDEPLAQ